MDEFKNEWAGSAMITHFDLVRAGIPTAQAHALMVELRCLRKWERLETFEHLALAIKRGGITESELRRAKGVGRKTIDKLYKAIGLEPPHVIREREAAKRVWATERMIRRAEMHTREGAAKIRDKLIEQAHRSYEKRIAKIEALEKLPNWPDDD